MANKKALGKGLRALIPDIPPEEQQKGTIEFVPVAQVSPNPFQPRVRFDPAALEELKQSIAEKGVVQPITVRKYDEGFQLIAGERRLRAVKDLDLEVIPAYIMTVESDEEMIELAIVENIHREDLNPIDIASGYRRLVDECKLTQEQVADRVGKDRTTITNFLRLLKLPRRIQESVLDEEISMGHARALLSLASSEEQLDVWRKAVKQQLSVRKIEELVRKTQNQQKPEIKAPDKKDYYIEEIENKLRTRLTTKVIVKSRSKGGTIEINYFSSDELDRLVSLICDQ